VVADLGADIAPRHAEAVEPADDPLLAPVTPSMTWASVHATTQVPLRPGRRTGPEPVAVMRRTATIRRGTKMIKLLSDRQVVAYLRGRLPRGFCYRWSDVAGLRAPDELDLLTGGLGRGEVGFALRWRAVDPADYDIPFSLEVGDRPSYRGLTAISPHHRVGPPVLGTGFAPSQHHLIPEFVTADLADLPMPAGTSLVAFAPDGTEVSLYLFLPEQRAWTKMFGPQWRHLLAGITDIPLDQEYLQVPADQAEGSTLVGQFHGQSYPALADPPHEFRVLAKVRAARYPVDTLARRTRYATWRGVECTVAGIEGGWYRLRLCRPDPDSVSALGAECVERGVYEAWAIASEVADPHDRDTHYTL